MIPSRVLTKERRDGFEKKGYLAMQKSQSGFLKKTISRIKLESEMETDHAVSNKSGTKQELANSEECGSREKVNVSGSQFECRGCENS